jgi:hypothetical protein
MRVLTHTLPLTGLLMTAALVGYTAAPSPFPAPALAGGTSAPAAVPAARALAAQPSARMGTAARLPTAAAEDDTAPYYAEGSQYSARYDQTRNTWRLLPADGPDVVVDAGDCSTGATVPAGVWLLVIDRDGSAELVAPSTTALADGAPDHVALRACDQASGRELAVPRDLLELLATRTGAIYVDN